MVSRERHDLTVVTATMLEYRAARAHVPADVRVVRAGIAMGSQAVRVAGAAISCGLAGGLRAGLATGTVVVPRFVVYDTRRIPCDAAMSDRLRLAAYDLGYEVSDGDLVTSDRLVTGSERAVLAQRGGVAADMESAHIEAQSLACVRVILDTPERELSQAWLRPMRALVNVQAWRELPFLMREGPRCAAAAGRVIARALGS